MLLKDVPVAFIAIDFIYENVLVIYYVGWWDICCIYKFEGQIRSVLYFSELDSH